MADAAPYSLSDIRKRAATGEVSQAEISALIDAVEANIEHRKALSILHKRQTQFRADGVIQEPRFNREPYRRRVTETLNRFSEATNG